MRSLRHARERARSCRALVGAAPEDLFGRVVEYLSDVHGVELEPTTREFLEGGRAEISPAEGCLFYDRALDQEPGQRLAVILHELGHLELHPRLKRRCEATEALYGSMYLNDGAPALARYNRKGREEAQATAFATEFLCPSVEVFDEWKADERCNSAAVAARLGVPVHIVQAQLAEALYRTSLESELRAEEAGARRAFECDPSQLEAATYTGGPALVNAGPGTGKTATLVRRVEHLLGTLGASPESILVLTFSNDAAEELIERIERKFGPDTASRIDVNTFHGFGLYFLQHHGQFAHVRHDAAVLDEAGQAELVTDILGKVECGNIIKLHDPEETVGEVVRHISYQKDRLRRPEALAAELGRWTPAEDERTRHEAALQFLDVFRAYEAEKAARNRVDFADLIALPVDILTRRRGLVRMYRRRFRWVLVDEYQDVSRGVASLLRLLCGRASNPPWVVGDMRQAIYRFRGAAPENVEQFGMDFKGARIFNLKINYRSGRALVDAANQLAALMEDPAREDAAYAERWRAGTDTGALGGPPVAVAAASSDRSEQVGVARQVREWMEAGVPPQEIAVLARRNVDARNIALALSAEGIRTTTSGIITAEGAAGDLAAVVTFADRPAASLPRLAFGLGRKRLGAPVINALIGQLLPTIDRDGNFARGRYGDGDGLAAELRRAGAALASERFRGDAFTMMCVFLFDGSDYLRRVIAEQGDAARALTLDEIVTSLSKAAVYRHTHAGAEARELRRGFGEQFRASLCSNTPCLIPPRSNVDAVRVMTCHASKGLEFPCVVVAGQTLSQASGGYEWLPPSQQPPEEDDARQSDAVLFVGATRARRALLITYADTAGGGKRAVKRNVTPLLRRWLSLHDVPTLVFEPQAPAVETITMGPVWGGAAPHGPLPARTLDKDWCPIRTYLEEFLGVSFPLRQRPLYPIFFSSLRGILRRILERAHEAGGPVGPDEAEEIFLRGWPTEDEMVNHPHAGLYLNVARRYALAFARGYRPEPGLESSLENVLREPEAGPPVQLDLIAHYLAGDGARVALMFRPESLSAHEREDGLLWGGLKPAHRLGFVLLRERDPELRPLVFSGEDGRVYLYQWTNRGSDYGKESARAAEQHRTFGEAVFSTTLKARTCDRCPGRVTCPHWVGALAGE